MADNARSLIDLALALSDGAPVDWAAVSDDSHAGGDSDVLRHLRVIADIVDLHRRLNPSPDLSIVDELQEDARRPDAHDQLPSWGPLRLIESIGEGAYGEVYRAWDSRLDREVALKLLRRRDSQRAAGTSLIEEGRLLAKLRHPNVITVYGADRIGDHVGIWMELVDGSTLEQVVSTQGPLPADEVIRIGRDLASALDAVHRAGLLHRDVKAQNVMRAGDGRIVLMDFGAGRERAQSPGVAGTPLYLAPELLRGETATVQSDIYSLGVLLYYAATATFPVSGRSLSEIRQIHLEDRALALSTVRPDLPHTLLDVVDRATKSDPRLRFESAAALERACAAALQPVASAERRRPVMAMVTVAAIIAAAGLGLPWLRSDTGSNVVGSDSGSMVTRRVSADAAIDGLSSISSDGRYITKVSDGNLVLLDTTSGARRTLTAAATPGDLAESSAFAPNDKQLAYVWHSAATDRWELRLVSLTGGEPRVLHSTPSFRYFSAIAWLPDGSGIVASAQTSDLSMQLVVVPAAGGAPRVLHTSTNRAPSKIAISPDGRFVAWSRPPVMNVAVRDVYVTSIQDGRTAAVVEHPADDFVVDWTSDGGELLFGSDRTTGSNSLWGVAVTDGIPTAPPRLVRPDIGRSWPFRITPKGSYFYGVPISIEDVYVGVLSDAGGIESAPTAVATSFVGSNRWPEWSRDGQRFAYLTRPGSGRAPLMLTITTSERAALDQIPLALNEFIRLRWSPDGRLILGAGRDLQGRSGIYHVDLADGAVIPLLITDGLPRQVDWSPDQKAVYYSLVGSRGGIMRLDLTTGRSASVLPRMVSFALSPDGRWVLGNVDDLETGVARLVLASVGGESRTLAEHHQPGAFTLGCAWTADSQQALCITRPPTGSSELWRYSVAGREPQRLYTAPDLRHIRLHPDGRRFAFVAGTFKAELWVMEQLLLGG